MTTHTQKRAFKMLKAPMVKINTANIIAELIGDYSEETQKIIHAIAENETELLKGCYDLEHYTAKIERFIKARK